MWGEGTDGENGADLNGFSSVVVRSEGGGEGGEQWCRSHNDFSSVVGGGSGGEVKKGGREGREENSGAEVITTSRQ